MATAAPSSQSNPPDPQVVTESSRTATNVNRATLLRNDPATAAAYANYQTNAQRVLTEKYLAEGASPASASESAAEDAQAAANQQFAPQIVAAGAGTFTNTTNPLLPQQPQPPSGPVTPVNPVANPQAPAAAPTPPPGRPLLPLRDDGSSFNRQIGDVREDGAVLTQFLDNGTPVFVIRPGATTPPSVAPVANPQVPDGSLPEEQASPAASAAPVSPAANPQVTPADPPSITGDESAFVPTPPGAALPTPVSPATDPQTPFVAGGGSFGGGGASGRFEPDPVPAPPPPPPARPAAAPTTATTAAETALATQQQNTRDNARAQAQLQAQRAQAAAGDWRLKLRLAPGSDYLYNAAEPGILQPLQVTGGVIFPYTPTIATTYTAQYNNYELTHSNYRGYFYQGSHVGELTITATFTAQDSNEAAYLLAVIQFFRSVTKMFYGQQDAFRGSPPPLVFLQGYGEFQFNLNPCVVQTFNYTLPADVDYIRAGAPNIDGTSLLKRRDRQTTTVGGGNPSNGRMSAAGLSPGGTRPPPPPVTLGRAQPTYVPTKMEMTLVLLPMQTRSQVSREFSMENFANGSLVQRGFW
jgi:hypothetical protein